MKIATFGCSFAHENSNSGAPKFNMNGKPWMKILSEHFNHDVTNYGMSASTMYYSYKLFKDNYQKFDKIVFFGTFPDRKHFHFFKKPEFVSPTYLTDMPDWFSEESAKLIRLYYTVIHDIKEHEDMKELMVKEIKNLGGVNALYLDTPTTLNNVSLMEKLSDFKNIGFNDHRWCHMSNENNFILASQINDWINGKTFNFDINTFKKPTVEELMSYYEST